MSTTVTKDWHPKANNAQAWESRRRYAGSGLPDPFRTVNVACNNCGARNTETIATGTDFEYETVEQEFAVVRCGECGLVYLNPRPDRSELPKIYPQDYLAYDLSKHDKNESSRLACQLRRRFYTKKIQHALSFLDRDARDEVHLLDIGAGDGRLLNWYRKAQGVTLRTYAAEMNAEAAEILRDNGHVVYEGLFEDVEIPERSFDVVHSSHVIEHVADPKEFAAKGCRLLKPGGLFVVETPNYDCLGARWFHRRYWGGYHFPRHWTFYTPESLTDALDRAGLEILDIQFVPNPVFWVWTMHHLLKEKGFPRFVWQQFPVVGIFRNSFANVLRLGAFTLVEKCSSLFWRGRMGSMLAIARRKK